MQRLKTTVIRPIAFRFMVSTFAGFKIKLSANIFGLSVIFKISFVECSWFLNEEKRKRKTPSNCLINKLFLCWFCVMKSTKPTFFSEKRLLVRKQVFLLKFYFSFLGKSNFLFCAKGKYRTFGFRSWFIFFVLFVLLFQK